MLQNIREKFTGWVALIILGAIALSFVFVGLNYRALCKTVGRDELTQRRITQMLSEIELSGIITGRLVHQGIHGRTKKYKLTISPEMVKKTFKDDLTLQDIV